MYKLGRVGALWNAHLVGGVIVFKSVNNRRVQDFIDVNNGSNDNV
jgi:hypothetical protein